MIDLPGIDRGRPFDWNRASAECSAWRPDYPDRFYELLRVLGVGLAGQRIVDLGTGAGLLALAFARAGAVVTGIDAAPKQVEEARRRAALANVDAEFRVATAESTGLPAAWADVVTASQSWHYFDVSRSIAEVGRILKPDGLLMVCNLLWLPRMDPVARASEALVLKHNPDWSAANESGDMPLTPAWSQGLVRLHAMFVFDEALPFTHESWRGRFRACRGIGASLDPSGIDAFDREHDALLKRTVPAHFTVLHRIDAHMFRLS